jgi:hypothetical protein
MLCSNWIEAPLGSASRSPVFAFTTSSLKHSFYLSSPPPPFFLSVFFVEMGSLSEKVDEKHGHLSIDPYQVDTGAQLVSGVHSRLDPIESLKIRYVWMWCVILTHDFERRRKIDKHILPLMCSKCQNRCWLLTPEQSFSSIILVYSSPVP